ncbi:MAG: hypothetical protein ACI4EI_13750 [Muricoprocola sp.]
MIVKPASGIKVDKIAVSLKNEQNKVLKSGDSFKANSISLITIEYSRYKKPKYYQKPSKAYLDKYGLPLKEKIEICSWW